MKQAFSGSTSPASGAPTDLFRALADLKREKNAVVLAHYYQDSDIQDVADFVGDSLELARFATRTSADLIVFAGVHFMAETAKILNPTKKVVLPDLQAGCSLADSCPAPQLAEWKKAHPHHMVVSYINCSAAVKALSDVIVTSSSAERILSHIPLDQPVLFAPDRNLGAYLNKKLGRHMDLWNGTCMVHEIFSEKKLLQLKAMHPLAKVLAHPECEDHILRLADHIGSTSSLLQYSKHQPDLEFIVVTEAGILHQMKKASPEKTFYAAPPDNSCACNECPHMKLNTLEKLWRCMKEETPEITMDEAVRIKALAPLEKMFDWSQQAPKPQ